MMSRDSLEKISDEILDYKDRVLDLSGMNLGELLKKNSQKHLLQFILRGSPKCVDTLDLSDNQLEALSTDTIKIFFSWIRPSIKTLHLRGIKNQDILKYIPNSIEEITLDYNSEAEFAKMRELLPKSIKKINLRTYKEDKSVFTQPPKDIIIEFHKVNWSQLALDMLQHQNMSIVEILRQHIDKFQKIDFGQLEIKGQSDFEMALIIGSCFPEVDKDFILNGKIYSVQKIKVMAQFIEELKQQKIEFPQMINHFKDVFDLIDLNDKDPLGSFKEKFQIDGRFATLRNAITKAQLMKKFPTDEEFLKRPHVDIDYIDSTFFTNNQFVNEENSGYLTEYYYKGFRILEKKKSYPMTEIENAMKEAIEAISYLPNFRQSKKNILYQLKNEFAENHCIETLKQFLYVASIRRSDIGFFNQNKDPNSLAIMRRCLNKIESPPITLGKDSSNNKKGG